LLGAEDKVGNRNSRHADICLLQKARLKKVAQKVAQKVKA